MRILASAILVVILAACSGGDSNSPLADDPNCIDNTPDSLPLPDLVPVQANDPVPEVSSAVAAVELIVETPLLTTSESLSPSIRLEGRVEPLLLTRVDQTSWSVSLSLATDSSYSIIAEWYVDSETDRVKIADAAGTFRVEASDRNVVIQVARDMYDISADDDNDGFTNFDEWKSDSNPRDSSSFPRVDMGIEPSPPDAVEEPVESPIPPSEEPESITSPDVDEEPVSQSEIQADEMVSTSVCLQEAGTDSNSSTINWDDNCAIRRLSDGGLFSDSLYTAGIQRILFCTGFVDIRNSIDTFADGENGPITDAAIRTYQRTIGIAADGVVNAETWSYLQAEITPISNNTVEFNDVAYTAYGVASELCEGSPLFYRRQNIVDVEDALWMLSRNPPNERELVPYSIETPYERL